jgi:hypothetical protein
LSVVGGQLRQFGGHCVVGFNHWEEPLAYR